MDLNFSRFEHDTSIAHRPPDLGVILVGVAARQASSATAVLNARQRVTKRPERLLDSAQGAFNRPVAAMMAAWREE